MYINACKIEELHSQEMVHKTAEYDGGGRGAAIS